jgi:opacity protein-like surface antigen
MIQNSRLVLRKIVKFIGLSLIFCFYVTSFSFAQTQEGEWNHTILTYLWVVGVNGDARVGPVTSDIDVEFKDILDKFSGGLSLIYEGYNEDWLVFFDGTGLILKDETNIRGNKLETKSRFAIVEGGIGHRITSQEFPKVFIGFRYIWADLEIDSSRGSVKSDFEHILDPIVGVYHKHAFTDNWGLRLLMDIGGFGAGTEFSWGGGIGTYYHFKRNWTAEIGYRILDIDYEGHTSDFDGKFQGLYLGVGKSF